MNCDGLAVPCRNVRSSIPFTVSHLVPLNCDRVRVALSKNQLPSLHTTVCHLVPLNCDRVGVSLSENQLSSLYTTVCHLVSLGRCYLVEKSAVVPSHYNLSVTWSHKVGVTLSKNQLSSLHTTVCHLVPLNCDRVGVPSH